MLKNTIKSIAALLLAAGSTLAADVSGTYVGEGARGPVVVQMAGQGRQVRGVIRLNGLELPLMGERTVDGQVQGVITADGESVAFDGALVNGNLVFHSMGKEIVLAPAGRQAQPQVGVPQAPAARQERPMNVEMRQGNVFATPVPQGWQTSQSGNEVWTISPDAKLSFGFTGLERINAASPAQFVAFMVNLYGHKNLRMGNVQRVQYPGATDAIEARIAFTGSNGVEYVGWVRAATFVVGGQMNAYMISTTGTPDVFEQAFPQLQAMADKIQIINPGAAFDRQGAMAATRMVQNRPMDHSFADAYWQNQKRVDGAMARGSDVRRDSYISTDPVTGQQYSHGQGAYDPTRGGVVNPERPAEILTPAPHWQGRD